MYNVAIIGAGQLGSRHLQALKLAASPLSIYVMDSNDESLKISKERYESVSPVGEKTIDYLTSIDDLPNDLDLAIIATGSKPRASIVKSLLGHTNLRYLILEKVLFPVQNEYKEIYDLLKSKNVQCWVNCNRRMFGMYKEIKELINSENMVTMSYAEENWGLCCNAIHMIDIFMYLTGENNYSINVSRLHDTIEESKRGGYIEMTGCITIQTEHGHSLSLLSENNYRGAKGISIKNGSNEISISEGSGVWSFNGVKHSYKIPYQSQLTGLLTDEILITGGCSLPSISESISYHKPFIAALLDKYNEIVNEPNNKLLPIT